MPVRSDVHVEWHRSPRIIVVEAPSISITVEDLVDTLRDLEDELDTIDDAAILDASGKQYLGPTERVGITVTLLNARLSFEQRSSPLVEGTASAVGYQQDLPGIILEDTGQTFETLGVDIGDVVVNYSERFVTTVIEVIDEEHLRVYDPTPSNFGANDVYKVYSSVECNVTGGNVVAVDVNGDPIEPIVSSAFTSVSRESSTSVAVVDIVGARESFAEVNWDKIVAEGSEIPDSMADLLRQAANNESIIIF
jgi:hypothetical protein